MYDQVKHDPRYANYEPFYQELLKLGEQDDQEISYDGHMLGGWPHLIQSEMELECEMVRHGISGEGRYDDPRLPALERNAKDWRLLLQLKSDEDLDWMWGDVGMIYFWCREDDIAQRRFERTWTILQCT